MDGAAHLLELRAAVDPRPVEDYVRVPFGNQPVGRLRAARHLHPAPQIDRPFRIQPASRGPDSRRENPDQLVVQRQLLDRQVLEEELPTLIRQKFAVDPRRQPRLSVLAAEPVDRHPPVVIDQDPPQLLEAIGQLHRFDGRRVRMGNRAEADRQLLWLGAVANRQVFDVGRAADSQPAPQPLHVRMTERVAQLLLQGDVRRPEAEQKLLALFALAEAAAAKHNARAISRSEVAERPLAVDHFDLAAVHLKGGTENGRSGSTRPARWRPGACAPGCPASRSRSAGRG
jgi:hypothetical protein